MKSPRTEIITVVCVTLVMIGLIIGSTILTLNDKESPGWWSTTAPIGMTALAGIMGFQYASKDRKE